jgi:hypothetical protein
LAAAWPAPVLLVEADPSGYSSILAGAFAGSVPVGAGVLDAAMSARAGRLPVDLPGMLVELPVTNARVLPGLSSVAQRKSLTTQVWADLGAALRSWADESGIDVLIDCGALADAAHPAGLHPLADAVVLVTRPDLVGVSSTRNWVDELADTLPDPARLHLMVTGSHPAYPASTVAEYLHLPLLADLGEDPTTAAHYSHGTPLPRRHRGLLTRSLPAAASALQALAPEVVHV